MKKKMVNRTHIEGYIYESKLEEKISGPNSKNPNTPYITGTLNIATDEDCTNIVPIHFTYLTEKTGKGKINVTYGVLKNIVDGAVKTVMNSDKNKAGKVRIDSTIGLNEFYSDQNGEEELVSVRCNEGGFVHMAETLTPKEEDRNTFDCDIVITNVTRVEANEERDIPEHVTIKGAVFDFRNSLLPVELTALNPDAMNYFEGLDANAKNPVFTRVWGNQVSKVVVKSTVQESAFGDARVRESRTTHKDFVITGANPTPYDFGEDSDVLTITELNKAITDRETYLATLKQRRAEYKAAQNTVNVARPVTGDFKF